MWLSLLAFAGLLLGHFVAFIVVAPDEGARYAMLEATGHHGHGLFMPIAGAALLGAIVGLIANLLRGRRFATNERSNLIGIGVTLWALQTTGFVFLEAVERSSALHGISGLLHEPAFLVGLVIQAITALVGALLVVLLTAAVGALCRFLRRPVSEESAVLLDAPYLVAMVRSVARLAWNLRGPPVSRQT